MSRLLKDYFWIAFANFFRLKRQCSQKRLIFSRKAYQFARAKRIRLPPTYSQQVGFLFAKLKVGDLLIRQMSEVELENGKVFEFDLDKYERVETNEVIRYEYEDGEEYHKVCLPKKNIVSMTEYTKEV